MMAQIKTIILIIITLCLAWVQPSFAQIETPNNNAKTTVILIHGFLGATSDLAEVEQALIAEGYKTVNIQYETRNAPINELADEVFKTALSAPQIADAQAIDVVTHSMGGLILRSILERTEINRLRRVVMIAPPNQGSQVAEQLAEYPLYREYFGPAGVELGALQLQPQKIGDYQLGIIAGTSSVNPIFSRILPGIDDGYVALKSTPLKGMNDFITIPSSHGLITSNESTVEQTLYFLQYGHFNHDSQIKGFPFSTYDFFPNYTPE